MKKSMHNKIAWILIFSSIILGAKAQYCSTLPSQGSQNQASSQPSTCVRQILDEMSPKVNDRTIDVNVYFWVFAPTTNSTSAAWTNASHPMSQNLLQQCLDGANATYTNIPAIPQLTVAGTPTNVTNVKIRYVLKGWQIIHNDLGYKNIIQVGWGNLGPAWNDHNAINVYLGTNSVVNTYTNNSTNPPTTYTLLEEIENIASNGNPGVYPDNTIHFTPAFHKSNTSPVFDYIELYGDVLAHELSHMLGLWHTTGPATTNTMCCTGEPISFITPTFGCCSFQECNDYAIEHYLCSSNTATSGCKAIIPHQSCGTPGGSDNLMSQNAACNRYLSPQQMAVMHFNLRTIQSQFLTASSFTAALDVNTGINYSVTAHETWDSDRYFKGNVIVKSDKTLTIKCVVAMSRYGKIIVEPGAQLIIDGGTVTNISGLLWEGIFLQGNPNQSQTTSNTNNTGAVLYQGMLRIKNNGTISHANIGVRNYLTNIGNTGGVIFAQNANFINNVKDVYMSSPATGAQPSVSWFYDCNFITNGSISGSLPPIHHVELRNIKGVKFLGCQFKSGATPYSGGNGIFSVDAIYAVDKNGATPCVFEGLVRGIYVNNINPLKTPMVSNSTFTNNWYGAYFMNANNLVFQTNTLTCSATSGASEVYLNNCKYYKIKNNLFSHSTSYGQSDIGISVYNSKTGAHEIFRNTFSNLSVGINCMDDNGNSNNSTDGLKMNCNDFHINLNSYDVVLSYSTGLALPLVNKTQGSILSNATAVDLVRNIYGATCGNQNKWQIYTGSTVTINHGSNTNTVTAVTQPTATGCKSSYLNVVDKSIPLNYSSHCPASPPSSGGTSSLSSNRLASMNEYISDLLDERAIIIAGGNAPDDFELQSTVISKLNLYLTDSALASSQEVINILEANQGFMEDADIQTVFAYLHHGDFQEATNKTTQLGQNRADWKTLLTQVIAFQQDTVNGMDNISQQYIEFFEGYANSADKDGKALAQALLMAASVTEYGEPHALPEGVSSSRMANQKDEGSSVESNYNVDVFPNPTKTGINVNYNAKEEALVKIELKDLLGKIIYTNFSNNKLMSQYISLTDLKAGMYILIITKDKEMIYTTKIIKED